MVETEDRLTSVPSCQEHVTPGFVSRLLRLSSLAPDIITAIVNGKFPRHQVLPAARARIGALHIAGRYGRQCQLPPRGFHARKRICVRRTFDRGAFAASRGVPLSSANRKVDPQMPPERVS